MDFSNIFVIIGAVVCIGGILVVALGAFLARKAFGARTPGAVDRDEDRMWQERGSERPRHDSDNIESSGGFGNAPSNPPPSRRDPGTPGQSGFGGSRRTGNRPAPPRDRRSSNDKDDDIRSGGGFG